jgi:histidinol-phosphate aminotransferase
MTTLPIRPDLVGKSAYGAPQLEVPIKLNTNENPFEHDRKFATDVASDLGIVMTNANRYPDRDAIKLREKLAQYMSEAAGVLISAEQVWPANGSNEVLMQLFQLFGGPDRIALGFEPSYSMHPIISQLTNTSWISIDRDEDFKISNVDQVGDGTPVNLILVCTPNNPTGNLTSLEIIKELHDSTSAMVIVDEAYAEFSDAPSAVTLIQACPRLAVVRTMSKAFGFAGVRLGYVVGSTELIAALQLVRLPYHLSSLTQQAAISALATANSLRSRVELLIAERNHIAESLAEMGFTVVDSDANFILFGKFQNQGQVWEYLLNKGILVRDVGIPGWLRVTCGTPTENSAFLAAMAEFKDSKSD